MAKYLSVIIPTHNRVEVLEKCLRALAAQTYPGAAFEVIIADDGSDDRTGEMAAGFIKEGLVDTKYFRQENKGPAAARNLGIKKALGEVVLFIGDDIIAPPDLLERHAAWHRKNADDGAGMLGFVTWDRELRITPFMRWLENGIQFSFNELEDGAEADPRRFFYTCNISLKRRFLIEKGLFDEDFPYAAFEDIELGHRLKAAGLKLIFDRKTAAWHYHRTTLAEACKRMIKVGESIRILNRKLGLPVYEPKSSFTRRILKPFKLFLHYRLASYYEERKVSAGIFKYVLDCYFASGVERSRERDK